MHGAGSENDISLEIPLSFLNFGRRIFRGFFLPLHVHRRGLKIAASPPGIGGTWRWKLNCCLPNLLFLLGVLFYEGFCKFRRHVMLTEFQYARMDRL